MHTNTFPKSEKLCSFDSINNLFAKGNSFNLYPFKVVWIYNVLNTDTIKLLVTAPKKNYKHAVDRNYIKRCMREAFRKNNSEIKIFLASHNVSIEIAVIYTATTILSYHEIEKKMILLLAELCKKLTPVQND